MKNKVKSFVENRDCIDAMKEMPDNYFDLAICDPPYGIGSKLLKGGKTGIVKFHEQYELNQWDNERPRKEYFLELFRVSKNQIIWGANYFLDFLPPSRGIISWDKNLGSPLNFSHFELAWTSFDCIARKVVISSNTGNRMHPTQKPIKLYEWLLKNYAKKGDKILDTHLGSGSSRIAAYELGFDFWGYEIDKDYFEASERRFKEAVAMPLFDNIEKAVVVQDNLFNNL
jgi:site-specific DNA-methyltransferase (adenine-specific)